MNSPDNQPNELQRREQELRAREKALRLRELEAEISSVDPPLHRTVKHEREDKLQSWKKKLIVGGKFFALVVAGIVSVKVATWLAGLVIVGAVIWFTYKLFFESETTNL